MRYAKKIILPICVMLYCFSLMAQDGRKYKKETTLFLNSIRDSLLVSSSYARFIQNDTLLLREYLWNYRLFGAMVLAGDITQGYLEKADKEALIQRIAADTTKYFIKNTFKHPTRLVTDFSNLSYEKLSKPIFLKSYTLCVLSVGDPDNNSTFLFRRESKKHWRLIKRIGHFATD